MATPILQDQLPGLGEWDGPVYGQLGVLEVEEDRVRGHACGRWYKAVSHHARWTHQLTAAEYRAIFGLNATTPLDAPALRALKRRNNASRLAQYHGLYAHLLSEEDPEERRARASRPRRLQTHVDPAGAGASCAAGCWLSVV